MLTQVYYQLNKSFENISPGISFIVGMGRSGTTLLTNMLNSHPNVIATPENEFMLFSFHSFFGKKFNHPKTIRAFTDMFAYNFSKIVSIWKPSENLANDIEKLNNKTYANVCKLAYLNFPLANKNTDNVTHIVDKNPIYSLHISKINKVYPDAKYIVLVRDFRDNAVSRKKYGNTKDSIFMLAASWNYFYKKIVHDLDQLQINYIFIKYEDLASEPETTLKTICNYLEVEYAESMLHFRDQLDKTKEHAKQNLSNTVFDKITEMHANLYKEVNTNRVNAYEKELSKEEISVLNYFCQKFGQKFNYLDPTANPTGVAFSWKLKYFMATTKLRTYYSFKNIYYRLPLNLRLKFLDKF